MTNQRLSQVTALAALAGGRADDIALAEVNAGIIARNYEVQKRKAEDLNAARHGTIGRVRMRGLNFRLALKEINQVAGGEPRRVRRSMARAKAKRAWLEPKQ